MDPEGTEWKISLLLLFFLGYVRWQSSSVGIMPGYSSVRSTCVPARYKHLLFYVPTTHAAAKWPESPALKWEWGNERDDELRKWLFSSVALLPFAAFLVDITTIVTLFLPSLQEAAKTSDNAEEERRENVKEDLGENGQVAVARKEEKGNDSSGKKSKKTNGNVENVSKGKKVVPKVRRSVSSVESRAVASEATVVDEESEENLNSDTMNSGQPRRSGGRRGASASSASRLRQHFASLIGGGGGSASIGPVDFASSSSRTASLGRQRTVTLLGSSDDCNLSVLDDERSESTPVLLSVKPRRSAASASDSGHETGAESNHSGSPMLDAAQR